MTAILSVGETRKRLEISVREYLADVLPEMADRKVAEVAAPTPMAWKARRRYRAAAARQKALTDNPG